MQTFVLLDAELPLASLVVGHHEVDLRMTGMKASSRFQNEGPTARDLLFSRAGQQGHSGSRLRFPLALKRFVEWVIGNFIEERMADV